MASNTGSKTCFTNNDKLATDVSYKLLPFEAYTQSLSFLHVFSLAFFIIIESGLGLVRLTFRASLEESKIQNVDNFSSVLVLQKRSVLELGV